MEKEKTKVKSEGMEEYWGAEHKCPFCGRQEMLARCYFCPGCGKNLEEFEFEEG